MSKYERPVVLVNEELAEGVYAGSGDVGVETETTAPVELTGPTGTSDCWSFDVEPVQAWNGSHKVFQVNLTHHTGLQHISGATKIEVTFNLPLSHAYAEFTSMFSGSTLTIDRGLMADAYNDGDLVSYKVWASTGDQATSEALQVINVTVDCRKEINVQGNGGDEITS